MTSTWLLQSIHSGQRVDPESRRCMFHSFDTFPSSQEIQTEPESVVLRRHSSMKRTAAVFIFPSKEQDDATRH